MKQHLHYLVIILFSATLMFPGIGYDPIIDYYRLKEHYSWLTPEIYYPIYNETKKYANVSMDDMCALIQLESGDYCRNNTECMKVVRSYAGAIGLCQIIPSFHHKGNRNDLENPALNIMYGTRYYAWCLQYMKGNKKEALRCYNAGPASNPKTYKGQRYVRGILKHSKESPKIYNVYYEVK